MQNGKHTAVYVRVSTNKQDTQSQIPDLAKWCHADQGLALDVEELSSWANTVRGPASKSAGQRLMFYRDKFTGKTMDRPAMTLMQDALSAGQLDRIVVWRLDRLGRTVKGLCALFDELRERNVDLVSLRDGFSLNSPAGRLHARILASVAEYETEVRAERVRAGQAAARAKGKRWGGSEPGRYLKVTPDQESAILRLIAEGARIAKVSRITGLSRPTIYRVLRNQRAAVK